MRALPRRLCCCCAFRICAHREAFFTTGSILERDHLETRRRSPPRVGRRPEASSQRRGPPAARRVLESSPSSFPRPAGVRRLRVRRYVRLRPARSCRSVRSSAASGFSPSANVPFLGRPLESVVRPLSPWRVRWRSGCVLRHVLEGPSGPAPSPAASWAKSSRVQPTSSRVRGPCVRRPGRVPWTRRAQVRQGPRPRG